MFIDAYIRGFIAKVNVKYIVSISIWQIPEGYEVAVQTVKDEFTYKITRTKEEAELYVEQLYQKIRGKEDESVL
jgi:hypothetical protein